MDKPKIELIHGDCLKVMNFIPDESVDLILTDPPYGITACKWDDERIMDIAWILMVDIAKSNTPIVITTSQPFTGILVGQHYNLFRHEWIYKKKCASNFAQARYAPMKEHENIIVFGKKKINYYPIKEIRKGSGEERVKYKFSEATRHKAGKFVGEMKGEFDELADELRYPSSVQEFNNRASGDRGLHPTQKPKELMRYLIKTYSKKGSVVLDPFMGSGTTGVACKELNRNFIGIEINKDYYDIAVKRINNTMESLF